MLMQCEGDEIRIAPAVPAAWRDFAFTLRAYDDLFVSVRFMDGRLASLRVRSGTHYSGRTKRFILADGKIVSAEIGTEWKELAKLFQGS